MVQCDKLKCLNCNVTFELKNSETNKVMFNSNFVNGANISFSFQEYLKDFCGQYKITALLSKMDFQNSDYQTILENKSILIIIIIFVFFLTY